MAFCSECGTPHETGQRFCANCGTKLGGVITQQGPVASMIQARAPVTGMSIASFVFGLFSVIGAPGAFAIFGFGPMILGALAIISGLFAHGGPRQRGLQGDALATAGIVLGVIGTLLGAVLLITIGAPWAF